MTHVGDPGPARKYDAWSVSSFTDNSRYFAASDDVMFFHVGPVVSEQLPGVTAWMSAARARVSQKQ